MTKETSILHTFGYTDAYFDTYIKLIYLRSRMYSPETGRFTTRDSWQGDYNRPLSLNRWNYVDGNPVNYIDPSGHYPICDDGKCRTYPDWWLKRSHLYVEGYGYFDTGHLQRGWGSAKWIEESIDALVGGGEIHLSSKAGEPPVEVYWVDYYVSASVKTLDKAQKTGVMYGIYTDFERGYETYQWYSTSIYSAFSPEDLPSDHLEIISKGRLSQSAKPEHSTSKLKKSQKVFGFLFVTDQQTATFG